MGHGEQSEASDPGAREKARDENIFRALTSTFVSHRPLGVVDRARQGYVNAVAPEG